ncbi:hypothetical protein LPJ66_008377 [Kickxella alabastrina]|uniref:Uncharacterized protein n=1 Tax=Kickxella alabastrina TaxID=61397 RepID=A0ACC1I7Q0_9FUNG|nr:hypothetical protein LPJ66_008377 [Kickxella alabastrina]
MSSFTRDTQTPGKFLFKMPHPPEFTSAIAARRHIKQRLIAAFRLFAKLHLDEGIAGHLTCRDPQYPDLFWVNPFGKSFSCITAADLILVNHQGNIIKGGGGGALNAAAFVIHSKIHAVRADVQAACHSHSLHGKAFSALGQPLKMITQDACMFFGDAHAVFPGFHGVVADEEEGEKMAECLGPQGKALVMQNHGLLTVGGSVDEAAFWFIALDRCCHAQLLAMATGCELQEIPAEVAQETSRTVGSANSGWFNFQPYFEMITREQPDILGVDEEGEEELVVD